MKIRALSLMIIVVTGIQLLDAARTGWQYHRGGALNLWKGFSLSGMKHHKNATQLRVADLRSDGIDSYTVYFPMIHPLMSVSFNITSNFYTESLELSQVVNEVVTSKKNLHGLFGHLPTKVPLSIPKRYDR